MLNYIVRIRRAGQSEIIMFAERSYCLPNFSGIVGRVTDDLQWDRLGRMVRAARGARSQKAIHGLGGPTDTTIGKIETGQYRPTRGVEETLRKLEKGLGWQPGDAARVLRGDNIATTESRPLEVVLLSQVPIDDLLAEIRNRVVSAGGRDRDDLPLAAVEFTPPLGDPVQEGEDGQTLA